jgi:hypothetical protein
VAKDVSLVKVDDARKAEKQVDADGEEGEPYELDSKAR